MGPYPSHTAGKKYVDAVRLAGATPLIALDMYEHAYHMDYGAKAGAYVDAFMATINWGNADKVFEKAVR